MDWFLYLVLSGACVWLIFRNEKQGHRIEFLQRRLEKSEQMIHTQDAEIVRVDKIRKRTEHGCIVRNMRIGQLEEALVKAGVPVPPPLD